jgi:osmotically inducible protein OsmC
MAVRSGSAEWHGNVESGSGTVTVGDGVFEGAYSYDSRFDEGKGTNPEQLIAAARASCFTSSARSWPASRPPRPAQCRPAATRTGCRRYPAESPMRRDEHVSTAADGLP